MGYIYIIGTIVFTVYGQLILKWRMNQTEGLPEDLWDKFLFLFKLVFDPFVFSGLAAAFVAALFWMAAMTKFAISYAYPFMSLSFVLVVFLSAMVFNESIGWLKVIGLLLVISGLIVSSQSA
ncbi:EamA family transporter [Tuberibacillus sp. Marseille-P3662]|uniref:EamA family transporter n=1 Tax=Tuberibacillus sp. Marseille-P3662 TaxID=1965358 RepID=UPI000A1CC81E|nr:EamA family transporter [Tuberibacillus sp. Marseille-P3662]